MGLQSGLFRGLVVAGLVLGLVGPAQAILMDRGSFTYTDSLANTGSVNLIYDPDLDITWVSDANLAQTSGFDGDGRMTWSAANAWAAGLTIGGMSGWRLPTTTQPDASCDSQFDGGTFGNQGFGTGCTGSEMGHLFYNELGGNAGESVLNQTGDTDQEKANLALFSNVQAYFYWSGTEFAPNTSSAWDFHFGLGNQGAVNKFNDSFAWAVRSGDVSAPPQVPEPSTLLLMGSGVMGLLGWRQWQRRG